MTYPKQMTYDQWYKLMQDAYWHPIPDIFGGVFEWMYMRGVRKVFISRALAEQYWQLGKTPPPF